VFREKKLYSNSMKHSSPTKARLRTVDPAEIQHFSVHAGDWWQRHGSYAPLHKMAPARMGYLKQVLGPLKGLKTLDIGCGGGLVCEPLSRLGAKVTGIDADENAIHAAKSHAKDQGLTIDYRHGAAEDLVARGEQFDAVLALEILEHVSDPAVFVELCAQLAKPSGKIVFSTLNRTWKSYGLGIFMAERILNWAPEGTHDWNKFIKPSELARMGEKVGLTPLDASGLVYKPFEDRFVIDPHNLDINYFMVFTKSKRS